MKDTYPDKPDVSNQDDDPAKRVLRRLRVLLIIWLVAFIAIIIWFTLSTPS